MKSFLRVGYLTFLVLVINFNSSSGLTTGLQNVTKISNTTDLISSASAYKNRRQASKGSRKSKPKSKGYAGKDSYLQVYESEPESYSTSYHHKGEEPSTSYNINRRSDTGNKNYKKNNRHDRDDNDRDYNNHNQQGRSSKDNGDDDYEDEDDHSDSGGRTAGYSTGSKFNKEQRDDYQKSGKLDVDSDDFGYDGDEGKRSNSGGRRGGGSQRSSNNNREGGDYRGQRSNNRDYRDSDEDYRGASSNDKDFSQSNQDTDFYRGFDDDEGGRDSSSRGNSRGRGGTSRSRSNRRRDDDNNNNDYDYEANDSREDRRGNQPEHRLSRNYGRSSPSSRHFISSTV